MQGCALLKNGGSALSQYEVYGELPKTVEGLIAYIGFPWIARRNWLAPGCLILFVLNAVLCTGLLLKLF
jgi:hypothetical protein